MVLSQPEISSTRPGAQGGKNPRPFSQRGSGNQAYLAGAAQGAGALEKSADSMAGCQGSVGHPIRGPLFGGELNAHSAAAADSLRAGLHDFTWRTLYTDIHGERSLPITIAFAPQIEDEKRG